MKRTDATLSVIGANASVGPFAYLRPNTRLGVSGKIGTFVETKNSSIGEGSKVPHLSYIGDTEVGEQSKLRRREQKPNSSGLACAQRIAQRVRRSG